MADTDDALIGLGFEVGGGLGRTTGRIVGKAGHLYLIQKDGFEHLELFEIDDLRSARFYRGTVPGRTPVSQYDGAAAAPAAPMAGVVASPPSAQPAIPASNQAAASEVVAPKRRLSDQIRRAVMSKDDS